jgi:hypothetical protein
VAGIGKNVFEDDPERRKIIIDAVEGARPTTTRAPLRPVPAAAG